MGYRGINKESLPVIGFVLFIALTFFIPVRRPVPESSLNEFWSNVFEMHLWTPLLLATFVLIRQGSPSLNAIAKVRIWNWVAIITLLLFLGLTVFRVPGLWWTWITLGVHLSTVLLVANATRTKLGDLNALTLGVGVSSFAAGAWEIVYTIGYFNHYDVPQEVGKTHLYAQLLRLSPLAIGGIGVGIAFWPPKISWTAVIGLSLTAILLGSWVLGNMWVDIVYDWSKGVWVQTHPFSWDQAILYRSSKATLAIGLVGLYGSQYAKGKGIRLRSLIGYVIIIPWTLMFLATTAFLGITWVKSLFAKEGKPPYFKTRSIHYDRRFDSPTGGGRN